MTVFNKWCVAVFKCSPASAKKVLVEVYRFSEALKGVQSLHFSAIDRVDDEVVFSFRIMVEPKFKEIIKNKLADKLGTLVSNGKYAIDPTTGNNLTRYINWQPEKKLADLGKSKFILFIDALKTISAIAIEMIENNYFDSIERTELVNIISSMLGCAEYGLLSTTGFEIGYYDRVEDKYCSYLRQDFPKSSDTKKTKTVP